jgi:hypothetical protein
VEITSNDQLEVGEYYHCLEKRLGRDCLSIEQCKEDTGNKYLGNRIWAKDDNNQALEKWFIWGPVEIKPIRTIYLCYQHKGIGFQSDCRVCNSLSKDNQDQSIE